MSILDNFRLKHCFDLFSKHTGQHIFSFLTLSSIPILKDYQKFGKKCIGYLEVESFEIFVNFGVNMRHFLSDHCNYLSIKHYWTTENFIVDPLKQFNSQICRNFKKNCIKTFKVEKFWVFCIFGVNLSNFHLKTAINSSEKPTGQHTLSLLTLFNVAIYKERRKFEKKCIISLKIGKL